MLYGMFLNFEIKDAEFYIFNQKSDIVLPELHIITQPWSFVYFKYVEFVSFTLQFSHIWIRDSSSFQNNSSSRNLKK